MANCRYRNFRLPAPLIEEVESFLHGKGHQLGYQSTPEVIKQAIREFLERHD